MWYKKTKDEIVTTLHTNFENGLSQNQVNAKVKKYGLNKLSTIKNRRWFTIFLLGFLEPLSLVLLIAGILMISIEIAFQFEIDWIEFFVLIATVVINCTIQTVEQMRAKKSLDALQKLTVPMVTVRRDQTSVNILATNLVPGDIVHLEVGKYIPADIRIINSQQLRIDESSLTGESVSVEKNHQPMTKSTSILSEQKNMAFMSTFITGGRCEGIVVETGKNTEIGKIAHSISIAKSIKTPLQKRIMKLTKMIAIIAVLISVSFFVFLYLTNSSHWPSYIVLSVLIAIGVIPESLMVIISVILSISVQKMAKIKVIVKKMDAIETLGSLNVICSDKTGTLTKNKMVVQEVIFNNEKIKKIHAFKFNPKKLQDMHWMNSLVLCNDAINENDKWIGDPTEIALVDYTRPFLQSETKWRSKFPRIEEKPFDSHRKLMSTINLVNKKHVLYVKGALEEILKSCEFVFLKNKIIKMTNENKKKIMKYQLHLSKSGLRVLGFGVKLNLLSHEIDENNLIFLGAVAMIDPPREEVVSSIIKARKAGIETIMITGDHKETALSIAKRLKIAKTIDEVMDGHTIDQLSNEELLAKIPNIRVFARVNPEHKTKIVQLLQKQEKVVAMTGDGVNDAPSLMNANVGIAMGITGTDVAKDAAKIILQDDNFSTIIKGIEQGRNVFQKIRRAIIFVFASNIAEVLVFTILSIYGRLFGANIEPLGTINILYFNLIVETFLAIALSLSDDDRTIMYNPPYDKNLSFFKHAWSTMIFIIMMTTFSVILTFFIAVYCFGNGNLYDANAKIATIFVMVSAPVFYVYVLKLPKHHQHLQKTKRKSKQKHNYYLIFTMIAIFGINMLLIYTNGIRDAFIKVIIKEQFGLIAQSPTPILSWQVSLIAFAMSFAPAVSLLMFNRVNNWINNHFKLVLQPLKKYEKR